MQRVRIGLTGLAFVFVLVLLAAIFTRHSNEAPITENSLEQGIAPGPAAVNATAPEDPLAELGVAPRNPEANSAATQSQPPAPSR